MEHCSNQTLIIIKIKEQIKKFFGTNHSTVLLHILNHTHNI